MKTNWFTKITTDLRLAFVLLTRLPLPHLPEHAFTSSAGAVWAYPVVGAVLGGLAALTGVACMAIGLPAPAAAGLALAVLIVTSGAMHEDGLADVVDGFWGGQTSQRRLEIMKDSQVGAFGTLALFLVTGLRWVTFTTLLSTAPLALIVSAAASRAGMPLLMNSLPHARDAGLSQSVGRPSLPEVLSGIGLTLGLSLMLIGPVGAGAVLLACAVAVVMKPIALRKIGGQTGDVLGATQQISEAIVLCALVIAVA